MLMCFEEMEIRAALDWRELIAAMEKALAEFSAGRVIQPLRSIVTIEEESRYLGLMPAVTPEAMGLKAVTFYPSNASSAIPTHMAVVLLFRPDTGEPLAIMDGRLITEMRTAAVSAAVTNRLASPDSHVLALLGSGVQARSHLEALAQVRKFDDVRVWSQTPENARRFAEQYGVRATDAESAVRGADVVVVATTARQPVLRGAWLKPGAHVNAIGAPRPTWRELDDHVMANMIIVDSREAALKESGDVILSKASIYAEAGEIFAGIKPSPASKTTVFKSLGLAVEDIVAAKLVTERLAAKHG
ncbi:MAG: ornithine cyclodeaminase family protein [Acidobacteria bacterium]|nr:ornithine cyclodeaminase family protein [Acidobacteriota bacterium]